MKILSIRIALLLCISQLCTAQHFVNAAENPWNTWKKNSVQSVSYRPVVVDGTNARQLIEIRATVKVNSSMSGFLLFIQDVDNTPNWLVNASESKIIKQYSKTENSFYITLSKIWPLQARILILHSTYWQNADLSIEINLEDTKLTVAEQDKFHDKINTEDYLPVKTHSAHWKISPKRIAGNDSSTHQTEIEIEYIFIADGRGDTPKWLADHLALKSIWKSMRNIRRLLPKAQWQQQTIIGITELTVMPIIPKAD